jgi:hypothetical protein
VNTLAIDHYRAAEKAVKTAESELRKVPDLQNRREDKAWINLHLAQAHLNLASMARTLTAEERDYLVRDDA